MWGFISHLCWQKCDNTVEDAETKASDMTPTEHHSYDDDFGHQKVEELCAVLTLTFVACGRGVGNSWSIPRALLYMRLLLIRGCTFNYHYIFRCRLGSSSMGWACRSPHTGSQHLLFPAVNLAQTPLAEFACPSLPRLAQDGDSGA